MKQLWAPWRVSYIESEKDQGCIFCIAPGKKDPADALILYSGPFSMVMLNRFPYNSGHLMVAPKRHVADIEKLSTEEAADLFRLIKHSTSSLKKTLNPEGFNIGLNLGEAAGAGIADHLHFHIVPRWGGDTNFMPVLSGVKVVPEHLLATFHKLRPLFEGL